MLASGLIVTASACQNSDLYRALRGGGPGYGVILSLTVKAHPNVEVVAVQRLEIAPKTFNTSAILDAMTVMFQSFPDINDAGFAGYGYWAINAYQPLFGNTTAGYYHDFPLRRLLLRSVRSLINYWMLLPSLRPTRNTQSTGSCTKPSRA